MNKISHNPDVLSCLANLSNDEVFTPPKLANEILDLLPKTLWQDPQARFLDPFCKTGVFLREISARLMAGLANVIPDVQQRANHILKNQVFGIAITELTALMSRRSLYGSKTADGKYSMCEDFRNQDGNILYERLDHTWDASGKRCLICGASRDVYNRDDSSETYAYQFIHDDTFVEKNKMKFDVIVGNPPYQLNDGGYGVSAKPIYHLFVNQAKKLNPQFLTMIIPSRWFAGGKGLDNFREEMLNDEHICTLIDYSDSTELFPGVDIAGGICYFLWKNNFKGLCEVINIHNGKKDSSIRRLNEFNTFIRHGKAVEIIKKVQKENEKTMNQVVSSRKPFGLSTNVRPMQEGDLLLRWNGGEGKIPRELVSSGKELIEKWKVITSKVSYDHGGLPDKDGKRRVLSVIDILQPQSVCTETYIIVDSFDDKKTAENLVIYLKSKFVRFLVSLKSFSQDITKDRFSFVPMQDFSQLWTDEMLYKKYGISEEEVAFIDSMIRPMD